ncbi:MFS transporter [Cellulomonas fengjieae]|uniref:MFS transporter n=1 Tax=Cellulomonas fengjieae TaxID=2819978 RepID=A0ABS3SGF7_9CELL|nr:MFS transporter [Cellulomonas fengjieae]MBO3084841.1 MFS transporter [Cellulomonas fengjieae]QVI66845.1 MFS transporter [Cellulomonas fengjieae]
MTQTTTSASAGMQLRGRGILLLITLCGAAFLEGIDIAMFNIALPAIRADLVLETTELQWILSGYVIAYGGFMILGGRIGDRFGRRRVFLAALAVFIAFSMSGGLADEGWMLVVARFATGITAAFMMPAGLAIISTGFAMGAARNRAVLIYAGIGAAGFSLGLIAGGLLTAIGWRWVFFAPVTLGVVILIAGLALLPRDSTDLDRTPFDVPGAVLLTAGIVLTVLTVEQAAHGLGPVVVVAATGAAAAIVAFGARQRRAPFPLIPKVFLRSRPLLRAYLGAASLAAGFAGFQFIVVLYLQELRGWTALQTALAMLVLAIDALLAPTLTPRLVSRYGTWPVAIGGLALAVVSYALFLPVAPDWTYAMMFPSFLALGLAFTFAYGPLTIAATDDVADEDQGLTSGILYTSFQFGAALGLAAASAALTVVAEAGGAPMAAYRTALWVPLGMGLLGVAAVVVARPNRLDRPGGPSAHQREARETGPRECVGSSH